MVVVRWLTFAWGCLGAVTMAYYAISWAIAPADPLNNELRIGFGIGLFYGWPAWLGLPLMAYKGRQYLRRSTLWLLLAPVILAAAFLIYMGVTNGL